MSARRHKNGEVRQGVMAAVTRFGQANRTQVAEACGITVGHASVQLSELTQSGLLERIAQGVYQTSITVPRAPSSALQSLQPLPYREAVTELAVRARNLVATLGFNHPGARRDPRLIMLAVATKHIEDALDLWNGAGAEPPR